MKLYFLCFLSLCVAACGGGKKSTAVTAENNTDSTTIAVKEAAKAFEYTLSGEVTGKKSGKLYISRYEAWDFENIDSTTIKNGEFTFNPITTNTIEPLYLRTESEFKRIMFFTEPASISIKTSLAKIEEGTIEGGNVNKAYSDYKKGIHEVETAKRTATQKVFDRIAFNKKFISTLDQIDLKAYIIFEDMKHEISPKQLDSIVNQFGDKTGRYIDLAKERVAANNRTAIGAMAPDFKAFNSKGGEFTLSSLKGKVVLIDFWASWCGPCRAAFPSLKEIYKKYKNQGFEIVGMSLDDNETKWKDAIAKENIEWLNVSTLEGWPCSVANGLYGVNGIPHTVLLDKEGKIVGSNLHDEKLEETIKSIL